MSAPNPCSTTSFPMQRWSRSMESLPRARVPQLKRSSTSARWCRTRRPRRPDSGGSSLVARAPHLERPIVLALEPGELGIDLCEGERLDLGRAHECPRVPTPVEDDRQVALLRAHLVAALVLPGPGRRRRLGPASTRRAARPRAGASRRRPTPAAQRHPRSSTRRSLGAAPAHALACQLPECDDLAAVGHPSTDSTSLTHPSSPPRRTQGAWSSMSRLAKSASVRAQSQRPATPSSARTIDTTSASAFRYQRDVLSSSWTSTFAATPGGVAPPPPQTPQPVFLPTIPGEHRPPPAPVKSPEKDKGSTPPAEAVMATGNPRNRPCSESQTCGGEAGTHYRRPANHFSFCGAQDPSATRRLTNTRGMYPRSDVHASQSRREESHSPDPRNVRSCRLGNIMPFTSRKPGARRGGCAYEPRNTG